MTFTLIKGSSRPVLSLSVVDSRGAAIDFTTATAARLEVANSVENFTKTLSIVTPLVSGKLTAQWTSAETTNYPEGSYESQIHVDFADGNTGKWVGPAVEVLASL